MMNHHNHDKNCEQIGATEEPSKSAQDVPNSDMNAQAEDEAIIQANDPCLEPPSNEPNLNPEGDGEMHENLVLNAITSENKMGVEGLEHFSPNPSTSRGSALKRKCSPILVEDDSDSEDDLHPIKYMRLNESPAKGLMEFLMEEPMIAPQEEEEGLDEQDLPEEAPRRMAEIDENFLGVAFGDFEPEFPQPPIIELGEIHDQQSRTDLIEQILQFLNSSVPDEHFEEIAESFQELPDTMAMSVLFDDSISPEDLQDMIHEHEDSMRE